MTQTRTRYLNPGQIAMIERLYPELKDNIDLDSLGAGRTANGCYVSNAENKLRMRGEHKLAELLLRAAAEL